MGCDAVPNDEQHSNHSPAVVALEAELAAEMRPSGALGRLLVHRVAVLAARLDQCERHDAAMTGKRVRDAATRRENDRRAEVEALGQTLSKNPGEAVRRLRQTPEGIDHLLDALGRLRHDVSTNKIWYHMRPSPECELASLMGKTARELDAPDLVAAGQVITGRDGSHPDNLKAEPQTRARNTIIAAIDREMDALEELRDRVDDAAEAADKNEASARVLFDPSPDADRARKYEAATERSLFRCLREFAHVEKQARAAADEPPPTAAAVSTPPPTAAPSPRSATKRTQTSAAMVAEPAATRGQGGEAAAQTNPIPAVPTNPIPVPIGLPSIQRCVS